MAGPLAAGRNEKEPEIVPLAANVSECLPMVQGNRINSSSPQNSGFESGF
jgi:hypothetical protein